jgi:hypothetical protein
MRAFLSILFVSDHRRFCAKVMSQQPGQCSMAVEYAFGPEVARSCLDGFDFTLLFEESILTILPLGVMSMSISLLRADDI